MLIKFRATPKRPVYHGDFTLKDGETKDVADSEGRRLIADFPDNFSEVSPQKKEPVDKSKKGWRPNSNKMAKSESDK